jgi:hypothetical protein
MKALREKAKAGMARKLVSYGAKSTGAPSGAKGGLGDRSTPISSAQNRSREDSGDAKAIRLAKDGGSVKRLDRKPRKSGGRVREGSLKDVGEDKKLAQRRGDQKSTEGLKRSARAKRANGGNLGPYGDGPSYIPDIKLTAATPTFPKAPSVSVPSAGGSGGSDSSGLAELLVKGLGWAADDDNDDESASSKTNAANEIAAEATKNAKRGAQQ